MIAHKSVAQRAIMHREARKSEWTPKKVKAHTSMNRSWKQNRISPSVTSCWLIPDRRIRKRTSPRRTKEAIQIGENNHDGGEKIGFIRPAYHSGTGGVPPASRPGYPPR